VKYIIIGNGAAGMAAAEAVRARDTEGEVTIYTDENRFHYSRPRIIEYLGGGLEASKLTIRGEDFYTKLNIKLMRDTPVESIDPVGRGIILRDGGQDRFDRLVIASGASSFLPPIEGIELGCVFSLRTIDDADKILGHGAGKGRVVVIGGGLLGLETAASLVKRGRKVTVIEVFDRLLPRQLDIDAAAMLQSSLEAMGMTFHLGKRTAAIRENGDSAEVLFEDGSSIPADVVVFSAGIRSNLSVARDAGIACERGILVDERMETSLPGVFAAGDVAQFRGAVYGLWLASREQGLVAGANAAGGNVVYTGSQISARLKVSGIELVSLGSIETGEGVTVFTRRNEGSFKRLFVKDGSLVGAILIGDVSAFLPLQKLMKLGEPIGDPESLLK